MKRDGETDGDKTQSRVTRGNLFFLPTVPAHKSISYGEKTYRNELAIVLDPSYFIINCLQRKYNTVLKLKTRHKKKKEKLEKRHKNLKSQSKHYTLEQIILVYLFRRKAFNLQRSIVYFSFSAKNLFTEKIILRTAAFIHVAFSI